MSMVSFPIFLILLSVISLLSLSYLPMNSMIFSISSTGISSALGEVSMVLDVHSWCFILYLSIICASIFIYSVYYMANDLFKSKFLWILFSFSMSMLILVVTSSFWGILLGWDGLGISSFGLIMFFSNHSSFFSSFQAFLVNRFGDSCMLLFSGTTMLMLVNCSWSHMPYLLESSGSLIIWVIFMVGATTKSAQWPFSAWLPNAMAAPTPVSSLVHSSTLVTAGIYLLFRFFPLMEGMFLGWLFVLGLVTSFMASLKAMKEVDFKKIIALSTLSQLGFMLIALGVYSPFSCFFHLLSHASFKSLLFMCSGVMIHISLSGQDFRMMSSSYVSASFLYMCVGFCSFSLVGLIFFSGFFSKEVILMFLVSGTSLIQYVFFMAILSMIVLFTLVYSLRVSFGAFLFSSRMPSLFFFPTLLESNLIFSSIGLLGLVFWGSKKLMGLLSPMYFFCLRDVCFLFTPVSLVIGGSTFIYLASNYISHELMMTKKTSMAYTMNKSLWWSLSVLNFLWIKFLGLAKGLTKFEKEGLESYLGGVNLEYMYSGSRNKGIFLIPLWVLFFLFVCASIFIMVAI